jgi:preprotein translocase subunit SecF
MVTSGVIVLAFLVGAAVRQLAPETALGALLGTPLGLVAALVSTWFIAIALYVVLRLAQRRRGGA